MGGSGGGGGIGFNPKGGGPQATSCELLSFTTKFVAENEADVAGLAVGASLMVVIAREDPNSVIFVSPEGKKLAELESSQKIKLLQCLREGHAYIAHLQEIEGDYCEVSVAHK